MGKCVLRDLDLTGARVAFSGGSGPVKELLPKACARLPRYQTRTASRVLNRPHMSGIEQLENHRARTDLRSIRR